MHVQIRLAQLGDVARMQAIEVDAGDTFRTIGLNSIADDDPPTAELLAAHIDSGTAWIAESGEGLGVGYAIASMVDGEGHLDQVSTIAEAAGYGIGRQLIDQACNWTLANEMPSITLTTFRDVPWNGPYYRRLGFVELPEARWGPELTALVASERRAGIEVLPRIAMRKQLEGS